MGGKSYSSIDEHDALLAGDREYFEFFAMQTAARAGICKGIIHLAEGTPFKKRRWYSVSEIAKARLPGEFIAEPQRLATVVEDLRESIVKRELVEDRDARCRLQVMNLHPSPHMRFRFDSDAARNSEWFHKSTEFVWIRRDILRSWWWKKYQIPPPLELGLDASQQNEKTRNGLVVPHPSPESVPTRPHVTKVSAKTIVGEYVARTRAKGQQPSQKGLEEDVRARGLRGGRHFLRESIREILGPNAIRRGRPPKGNSPK
jgi:hypothetical protein